MQATSENFMMCSAHVVLDIKDYVQKVLQLQLWLWNIPCICYKQYILSFVPF